MSKHASAGRWTAPRSVAPSSDDALRLRPVPSLIALFEALADPNRLTILSLLAEHGELNVTEIVERLGVSQPGVSYHLAHLKGVGLVECRREGKSNYYALHPTGLHAMVDHLFPDGGRLRLTLGGVEASFRKR